MKARVTDYSLERKSENEHYAKIRVEDVEVFNLPYLLGDMIEKVMENITPANEREILDVGAGTGILAVRMALSGANVTALDISDKACDIIRLLRKKHSVDGNIRVINGTLDAIKEDKRYDRVVFLNSLHHMLDDTTLLSIKTVLKSDGKAVFIEPLKYNPLAFIYRKLYKGEGRTEIEKPMGIEDIGRLKRRFRKVRVEGLYLLSSILLSAERVLHTNEKSMLSRVIFKVLNIMDRFLLKLPILKYLGWKVLIVAQD